VVWRSDSKKEPEGAKEERGQAKRRLAGGGELELLDKGEITPPPPPQNPPPLKRGGELEKGGDL